MDISEEAPEDAENSELMYPLYSRTERSMTVNGEGTKWWPLTKTASSILTKEGEVQLDCLGAISVYYGTEIAWLLGEWNNGTSGTFRRLGAALAVRPDLLADPSKRIREDASTRGSRESAGGGSAGYRDREGRTQGT